MNASPSSSVRVASTHGSHCRKWSRLRSMAANISAAWRSSSSRVSKPSRNVVVNTLTRPVRVIALVVTLILAGFNARDPGGVRAVPVDGLAQPRLEGHLRLPSRFAHQFLSGKCVAAVMPGAVLHSLHQGARLAYGVENAL